MNGRIRAREVRVVLGTTGEQLGVMKLGDALRRAQSLGLDLVEVAPTAQPPVCRIVDYGKFKYELAKQEKDRKHSAPRLKEIKFRVNIDRHDYETKLRHAEDFLDHGDKVRVHLQFRGRENAHKELGDQLMQRIRHDLAMMGNVEMEPKHVGRTIGMILAPLPAHKRKRKFAPLQEEEDQASGKQARPRSEAPPKESDIDDDDGDDADDDSDDR